MSVGDQVKREAADYMSSRESAGTSNDGLPIVVIQQGVTKLRLYYDNKSNRLIRTFMVHMLNGKSFWCGGKNCVFCNKIEELKRSRGWEPNFKLLPMERSIAYGVIYSSDWTSQYLEIGKPIILSMQWRAKRAIMEYFATLETNLLDSWLGDPSENYLLTLNWTKGRKGSANASLDVSQKKRLPELPADVSPLTDVWMKDEIVDPSKDEDAAKALLYLESQANMSSSLRRGEEVKGSATTDKKVESSEIVPDSSAAVQDPVRETIATNSGSPQDALTILKNRGCPDFGHHKGTGNTECILCPVEKECIQYTRKLESESQVVNDDDIPF